MELRRISGKLHNMIGKYKYAAIVLIVGIVLLLIPGKSSQKQQIETEKQQETAQLSINNEELETILQAIDGVGEVRVMLSVAHGERTQYITDKDTSDTNTKTETIIITDSNRNETGLIEQVNPQQYRGAIVVCQGADSAQVRLSITQAVSKITGLSTDNICVLKMK